MLIGVGLIDFSSSDFISKTLDLALEESQIETLEGCFAPVAGINRSLFKAYYISKSI